MAWGMGTCIDIAARRRARFSERELRISADLAHLKGARDWAGGAAGDFGMAEDETFDVKLAVSEAVTNAIVHGSRSASDPVVIEAHVEAEALVFEVRDCGAGPLAAGTATPPPADLPEGGRGLELVELVMDEVELTREPGGCVLRFSKRRAAAA